jgi:para-aminobenzoate synthetase component I
MTARQATATNRPSLPASVAPASLVLAAQPGIRDPVVVTVEGWTVVAGDPVDFVTDLAELDRLAAGLRWRATPPPVPFTGGAIGLVCDDLAPGLLSLPERHRPAVAPLPRLRFGVYDTAVCFPPGGGAPLIVAGHLSQTREPARRRHARWRARLAAATTVARLTTGPGAGRRAVPSLDRAAHAAAVHQAQEWIAAGDLYQLNLTLQLAVPWRAGGAALAHALWAASPDAAHAAWLRVDAVDVVSVSPETFLRTSADRAVIRPIKGTRPRRAMPAADRREAAALRASAKDAAEHVMIVDLERNDLGRVCVPGTVRVPALAALEQHPTVWHLTSTVQGCLRPDVGLAELLAATFPCGSVTGAPKRMAWERIRRLEPVRRGIYCGAIGVITRGRVDLSVAIRTAVLHDGVASYGTGGGIVADSEASLEWEEAMDKAAAFLHATGADAPAA